MSSLLKSVEIIGEHWKDSAYYSDAERWTHLFWNEGTLFRALFDKMDASSSVLELACGHGRHAEKVAPHCRRLILMDIYQENLDVCKKRLGQYQHVEYVRNNGFDFCPIDAEEVATIFCYDAMVHFSPDIVLSYLVDTARVLQPGSMALYHHSNYAAPLEQHYGSNPHARNHMTFALLQSFAKQAGLAIVNSRELDWGNVRGLDRLTLLKKP